MESETCKAIETAKRMMASKDYMGARSKLLEVQNQFGDQDTICGMFTMSDILSAANLTPSGCESDWYLILQVSPASSTDRINSQYLKLTNLLEVIKYDVPDASTALKLIQDAFAVLSNPQKRLIYDSKRITSWGNYEGLNVMVGSNTGDDDGLLLHGSSVHEDIEGEEKNGVSKGTLELGPLASMSAPSCSPPSPLSSLASGRSLLSLQWSAEDFVSGQVWAIYDADGMPRRYVVLNYVISSTEVCATFLEPHPVSDDEVYWVEENLPLVCGSFKVGTATIALGISRFSHLVRCKQSTKKLFYKIYPNKGEVWAMYRNWSHKWTQSELVDNQCRIVEILSDFCEDSDVTVVGLEEVPGYKTFFQRQLSDGFELIRMVPWSEMLSFSHSILSFTIPEIQVHGIPKGSLHLEPNFLPRTLTNS
ncbi:hypothetical protein Ancab_020222 [Ancistrocladus abbreviatus]